MNYSIAKLFEATPNPAASTTSVQALLFYEGAHTDSLGKSKKYSATMVEAIATATNEYLASGRRARFFADHEYSQKNVLGAIQGAVEARSIDTVPHAGMDGLIGKVGIYATVEIAGEDNVAAYSEGRIKEISVGIDLDGKSFGIKNAIYELSAVGIPALAGAALFALTIDQTVKDEESRQGLWREWDTFTGVLMSIDRASDDEIQATGLSRQGLKSKAVEDLADRLRSRFPPPTQASLLPTVPLFSKAMEYTPEQLKELEDRAAKFDVAARELATMQRSQAVSDRFSKLKDKAIALRSAGKLTPAKFSALGFDDSIAAVAKFSAGDDAALDKLDTQLDTIEEFATPVKMGSYLGSEPIPGEELNKAEDEVAQFMAGYTPTLRYSQSRTY